MPRASAVRAPATRDQADAYRFGLRRWEAALVRGDPVPLHEQIRSQRRAALAGVLLGLLGLCGAAVYALVVPRPDWRGQSVVVGSGSGAMYVVAHGPDRLVPVANLAAARLVVAMLRSAGATDAEPGSATPVAVPDDSLDGAPLTPLAAVPGAPAVPLDGDVVPPRWAVCDQVSGEGRVLATTVVGGATALPPSPAGEGVLVDGPDGDTWLVTAGTRHRVAAGDGRVLAALGLTRSRSRAAAADLVSLLPEGPVLAVPQVPGRGARAPAGLPGRVGDVLVTRPAGGPPRHFAVLAGGLQEVPELVAGLLREASGARSAREVAFDVVAAAPVVGDLPVAGWPAAAPTVRDPAEAPVMCWTWSADGPATGDVWVGGALPLPAGATPVTLAQADGAGERLDAVAVGAGGAVRATGPGRLPGAGPTWLVSPTGVGYGVADDDTAAALGLTAADPAPEAALRLLPTGTTLALAAADRVVDLPASLPG